MVIAQPSIKIYGGVQFLRKILGGKIMSVLTTRPQFLYPHSRQFPFDEVAEKIVKALEKRNWKVPGINIEFDIYGSGEAKYQLVREITGGDFKLYFCRGQGRLNGKWNDTAALCTVYIPREILEVYEDESGPRYYLYVGNDWEADKEWFMNSIKVHSRLNHEPRRYLRYSGDRYQRRRRAKDLVADNDLGREYSPEGDEPLRFNLEEKFSEIIAWLEEFVLKYILSFPEEDTIQPPTPMEKIVPYEGPWSTIFSVCEWRDASRIAIGKKDKSELPAGERHAHIGDGHRLVPLYVRCDGRFPEIANDGFIWCDVNQNITKNSKLDELLYDVRSSVCSFSAKYIVAINLKYSNHVYVADNSKFEETRQQIFEAIAPRDRLTEEEVGNAFAARGATIIPITEYKGGYKEPIVLINRELDFEEIEWLVNLEVL